MTTERLDDYQQQHHKVGIAAATVKKFQEDQSTNLAAMIAFWAFFSIFPLLLAFVTLLGYFLPGSGPGSTKEKVLHDVASMFPLLDPSTVGTLSGSWWALIVGLVLALWSGSAVVRTTQQAFDTIWEIPRAQWPKLPEQVARSIFVLATVGFGLVLSTIISSFVTGTANGIDLGPAGRIGGYLIALALDVGLFVAAFRLLTDRDISVREVLPGALLAGGAAFVLQQISSLIISRYLHNAQNTYGHFATVITILWWFYLQSIIMVLGAQLNVVLTERLHPRSLVGGPETSANHRAYQAYAQERSYHHTERVETSFDQPVDDGDGEQRRPAARAQQRAPSRVGSSRAREESTTPPVPRRDDIDGQGRSGGRPRNWA